MGKPLNGIQLLKQVRQHPHLLGHLAGKNLLSDIHSHWIHHIWDTNENKSLQAHRGSYKTTAVLVVGVVYHLLFHPDERVAIIRKKFTDASSILKTISNIMKMPAIKALFHIANGMEPAFLTDKDNQLTFNFKRTVTPEGNVNAYGIDTGITGAHFDRIICDDVITLKDRISKAEREKTKLIVQELQTNIIDPGRPICYIGTPWHKDDAWQLMPEPLIYTINDLNILTQEQIADKKSKITPMMFSVNYLLKHTANENALFSDPQFDRWQWNNLRKTVAHIDASYSGSDTTAMTILAERKDGCLQAIGFCTEKNVKDWTMFIKEKLNRYRVGTIYKEDNDDKGYTADYLRDLGFVVESYHESMNKHVKINNYLYQNWKNLYWDSNTDDEYMVQIVDYEEGAEPDDCPDSIASLLREAFSYSGFDSLYEW